MAPDTAGFTFTNKDGTPNAEELGEEEAFAEELDEAEKSLVPKEPEAPPAVEKPVDALRVVEAALFLGNRKMAYAELAIMAKTSVRRAKDVCVKLQEEYSKRENAVEVTVDAEGVLMQVKPEFLSSVSALSKQVELSRKAMRILGLIGKKGRMMQSELRKYFRGDIYGYITELKELGYIVSEKAGNTRAIKPTSKFYETFRMAGKAEASAPTPATPEQPPAAT